MISDHDAAVIKGMLKRGDKQQWITAWFGGYVNPGRVSEINTGKRNPDVEPAHASSLPPVGPYASARAMYRAMSSLVQAKDVLDRAIRDLSQKDGEGSIED